MENMILLINELRKLDNETPWVEFKHNNYDPMMIGSDISALANGAALHEKSQAYMLWGIHDKSHDIVGTDYNLQNLKKGNQELENWLRSLLSDNAEFTFDSVHTPEGTVGILTIQKATIYPVAFEKTEFIRIGSYTKKLRDYPAIQAQFWDRLRADKFENQFAKQGLSLSEALRMLDYTKYFDYTGIPQPSDENGIQHFMVEEGFIVREDSGQYAITNLGAILLSKKLSAFERLGRKAVRVVQYDGNNRLLALKDDTQDEGYAIAFENLIRFINALLPSEEVITDTIREKRLVYPELAIREVVANALIHQDFSITGTGPTVEIFANRIEITNSGAPLIDIMRIIDNPPKSRNEKLAALMRRLGMCEELGTGWDKIVISCELHQLPAPKIEEYEDSTRVTLFSNIPFSALTPEERLWACYLHACIMHVQGEQLTNSSLRKRFGLKESSSGSVSRLIKEAVEKGILKPLDPSTAPRYMKYIPIWA